MFILGWEQNITYLLTSKSEHVIVDSLYVAPIVFGPWFVMKIQVALLVLQFSCFEEYLYVLAHAVITLK